MPFSLFHQSIITKMEKMQYLKSQFQLVSVDFIADTEREHLNLSGKDKKEIYTF